MTEPKKNATFRFHEESDDIFKLFALGYDDFRVLDTYNFIRTYDWVSLHFIRNGRGTLCINNREYHLSAGDFFLIPSSTPVIYYRDECDPWRYYWFAFSADTLFDCEKLLKINAQTPVRTANSPRTVTSVLDSLFETSLHPAYFDVLSALMQIIGAEQPYTHSTSSLYSPESLVEKTKNIIEMNYSRPDFSVGNICNILYVSQQHLCRLFKKSMGITPVAYLADIRINAAARLLEHSDYPIRILSERCGFDNEAYFMRCFKKTFGMTVKEYRRNYVQAGDF